MRRLSIHHMGQCVQLHALKLLLVVLIIITLLLLLEHLHLLIQEPTPETDGHLSPRSPRQADTEMFIGCFSLDPLNAGP